MGLTLAVGLAVEPEQLSNHPAAASDFISTANFLARFVYSSLTKGYQLYRFLRDTEPVNTVAVVIGTLLVVYFAIELIRMLFRELFGLRRSFQVDISQSSEVRDLNEQLKTIQKEMRDIGRAFRMQKQQQKKNQSNQPPAQLIEPTAELPAEANEDNKYTGMLDQLEIDMRLNSQIEQTLNGSCDDILTLLKRIEKKAG